MEVRGSAVDLLRQAKEEAPLAALPQLGYSLQAGATPPSSHGESTEAIRQRLLHCLFLSNASERPSTPRGSPAPAADAGSSPRGASRAPAGSRPSPTSSRSRTSTTRA